MIHIHHQGWTEPEKELVESGVLPVANTNPNQAKPEITAPSTSGKFLAPNSMYQIILKKRFCSKKQLSSMNIEQRKEKEVQFPYIEPWIDQIYNLTHICMPQINFVHQSKNFPETWQGLILV